MFAESNMLNIYIVLFNIALFFVLSKFAYFLYGSKVNFLSVFALVWIFLLMLAELNLGNYYELSFEMTILYYIPLLGILLGSFIAKHKVVKKSIKINTLVLDNHTLGKKELFLSYILLVISVIMFIIVIKFASSMGFSLQDIKNFRYSKDAAATFSILENLAPIIWFYHATAMYLIILALFNFKSTDKKRTYKVLSITSLALLIFESSMGSREAILWMIELIVAYILIISIYNNRVKYRFNFKSIKRKSIYAVLSLFIAIVIVSLMRKTDESNNILVIYNYFISYFTGPFVAADQMILTDKINDYGDIRFGLSFWGLDSLIVSGVMRFLFQVDIQSLNGLISYMFHFGVYISETEKTNAFYTCLLPLYMDGGIWYIFFYFIVIGFITLKLHTRLVKKYNLFDFSIYMIFYLFIFMAPRTLVFMLPSIWLLMLAMTIKTKLKFKIGKRSEKAINSYN